MAAPGNDTIPFEKTVDTFEVHLAPSSVWTPSSLLSHHTDNPELSTALLQNVCVTVTPGLSGMGGLR